MEVAGIEAEQLLILDGVAEVELVRADCVAFGAEAEELAFDGVEVETRIDFLGKDFVEGLAEAIAGTLAIDGYVFIAVGDPNVGHAGRTEGAAEGFPDFAAGKAVGDPEAADFFVVVGQSEAGIGQRGREESRVEVEAEAALLSPVNPGGKMFGLQLVAIDSAASVVGVDGV